MQRREFIGGVLWTTFFARLGFAEGLHNTLLALAHVVIPDKDPAVWRSGDVAVAMIKEIEGLNRPRRDQVAAILESLKEASTRKYGKDFHEIDLLARTELVKKEIELSEDVKQGFTTVRAVALRCFYGSSVGRQRTGYRETDQFVGYPEHVQQAETWE